MAPLSMSRVCSAISDCINNTRRAEQRCPALRKAELITSSTTCSGRAVESTIMQFWPPVSAIKGIGPPGRWASCWLMVWAVWVEPVKAMPATLLSGISSLPICEPLPSTRCRAAVGTPALWNRRTAQAAMAGVWAAGLAITVLPAARAAAIWPTKMANGKFQGLMQRNTPVPWSGGFIKFVACNE